MGEIHIDFFDTTLRDGAQSLPADHQFPDNSKPVIANAIAHLGIGVIEAGFPATPSDAEEVEVAAMGVGTTDFTVCSWNESGKSEAVARPPVIAGLSRTLPSDIEKTWAAVMGAARPRIHTFVSTDPHHMSAKFPSKTPDDVHDMARNAVRYAKEISADHIGASVEFSAEAASTTDMNYLERVVKTAVDAGADVINVPDTVGQRSPAFMRTFYGKVLRWVMATNPDVTVSSHNHNDLGMAVANSLALIEAAAYFPVSHDIRVQVETTICGLGERAGNANIFPIVASLFRFAEDYPKRINWEFNPGLSVNIAKTVMHFANFEIDRQSPVVGSDILAHRSGIHSDGILKGGHRIYTPFDPTFWGHTTNAVHEEGKYQGRSGRLAARGVTA